MSEDRTLWFDALELKLRRGGGGEFQRFFGALMSAVHGSDYAEVIPHGSTGDGGVDGYRLSDHAVYQCYGALNGHTSGIAYLKKKILDDFGKANATCPDMSRWVFAHNLVDGLPRPLLDTLLELKKSAVGISIDHFGFQQFGSLVSTLPEVERRRLLGSPSDAGTRPSEAEFRILTMPGVNIVSPGPRNHVKNEKFSFALKVRLSYGDQPFTLLGFSAEYLGPDGCDCLNSAQSLWIDGALTATVGNYFDLQNPAPSRDGLLLVEMKRDV